MTTLRDIADGLRTTLDGGLRAAVVTVVATEGSVYRRAGARCVVLEDGRIIGVVSGGCVEKDLLEHAELVWDTGSGQLLEYDFRTPDDLIWGMGLGCNGALKLWMQPLDLALDAQTAGAWLADMEDRDQCTSEYWVATILASDDPAQVAAGGLVVLASDVGVAAGEGLTALHVRGVPVRAFVERVAPRPRLLVFGAGDDARSLVRQARMVDWHVSVIDHRPDWLTEARFPDADERLLIRRDEYGIQPVHDYSFVISMTHNYELDERVLHRMIFTPIPYLGMLGPRQRTDKMLTELAQAGRPVQPEAQTKLHAPVGLDVGAETPEEIAVGVVGEIIARKNQREGGFLRARSGPIHPPHGLGHD